MQNLQSLSRSVGVSRSQALATAITSLSGLVAYYPLNESSGDAINRAPATLGTLNGTVTGTTRGVAGLAGPAYSFDGVDDRVLIPNFTDQIDTLTTLTMFGFIRPTSIDIDGFFGLRNADTDNSFYILGVTGTSLEYRFRNSGGTAYTIGATVSDVSDAWHMVALVLDGADLTAYLDGASVGTPVATATGSIGSTTQPLLIGEDGNNNYVEALIQHVGFTTTALTAGQLLSLARTGGVA